MADDTAERSIAEVQKNPPLFDKSSPLSRIQENGYMENNRYNPQNKWNLLNASDTRRGMSKAFSMWSDVSPFSFREVPSDQEADIKIGFYSVNHTDCLQSYLHHCFDGITGELAHAFFPQTGEIHFDDDEYWILGNMRFSWNKGRKGYCDSKRRLMQKHCPSSCDFCYEFPFPTAPPTATPPRTKHKFVVEGKNLTFRCGKKIAAKKGKIYWYKDGELLEFSHPGYISLKDDHITIVANAINEGTYTCIVRKKNKVLTTYSWRVRVRF
ncbi:Matrix metalloproteinase-23 [Anabarilius grahami]|uniref:Matrix metalloproteinase-23 n=1 Tax=Anabarilius grahami TaxID=495550 RepID=A0A3N0XME0_ANAGA|nr:Matrix metalloproteinase-23 [Anabarilius grahami]